MAFELLDKTGTLWLITKIKNALSGKVDKVNGKGLSTNDLTTDLKTSYDGAVSDVSALKKAGAEANKIDSISVNGTAVSPDSAKNVNISALTSSDVKGQIEAYKYQTSAQVDSAITAKGYQTSSQVESAITSKGYQTSEQVQSAITSALSGITGIDLQVVTSLPSKGVKGVIYLIAHSHSDSGDIYDEYVWVESTSKFEKIGNTDVDLSAYLKSADVTDISEADLISMWDS